MDRVLQICSALSSLFVELVQTQDSVKTETLASLKKQGQYLASCLKHAPEVIEQPDVLETLAIFAEVSPIEESKIFQPCNEILSLCLSNLTTESVSDIWRLSEDISLCSEVSKLGIINTEHFMRNIFKWISDPRDEKVFYLRFMRAISSNISSIPTSEQLSPIIPFLVDFHPVKCAMATSFLRTFKRLNQRTSSEIVAAWLSTTNHTPQNAYSIRLLFSTSSDKFLTYLSSLCLEFPSILAILPSTTTGLATLAKLTVHRLRVFSPDSLSKLLSCCDTKVRLMFSEASEDIPAPLRILDAIGDSRQSSPSLFDSVGTQDYYASCLMFARDSVLQDGSFIPAEIRSEILSILNQPQESEVAINQDDACVTSPGAILESLHSNKISEVLKTAPGIII